MAGYSAERVAGILDGLRASLDHHDTTCGDKVVGVALSPEDHAALHVSEIWDLPILAASRVEPGRLELLCSANCVLVPPFDTFEDVADRWKFEAKASLSETS